MFTAGEYHWHYTHVKLPNTFLKTRVNLSSWLGNDFVAQLSSFSQRLMRTEIHSQFGPEFKVRYCIWTR
ncbi:hypothetical protein M378DRAFT_164313 [Amanita muscaria Koide BX008]|uniref:Uncharacterized protein n=1 Tax=Amanita muscaria (strain Koide BX008) TaxID=946122 RepID=A0A0C2SKA2_AMAMK|nr:hypothetical protein M378DRAFT_164313 [Amanita muscaria Koide BX008]